MSAFVNPPPSTNYNVRKPKNNTTTTTSDSPKDKTIKDNTGALKKGTDAIKTGVDAFNEIIGKLFDWIEVRLSRRQRLIDNWSGEADNAIYLNKNEKNVGYKNKNHIMGKNDYMNWAMSNAETLKTENTLGAKKYFEQATTIANEAIKNKLVSAKAAADIIKRIQNGTIDISKYDDNVKTFISAYQEWYEKGLQCQDNLIEINAQLKEMQQTKLDNITERFETLVSYYEQLSSYQDSLMGLYNMQGRRDNNDQFKKSFRQQISEQKKITKGYNQETAEYARELVNARKQFGVDSNEYREALTKYNEMKAAAIDSQARIIELQQALYELDFKPIEYAIDKLSAKADQFASIVGLKEARGTIYGVKKTRITENDYQRQINNNNDLVELYAKDRAKRLKEIEKFGWKPGSEKYESAMEQIRKDDAEILKLRTDVEGLKDSIIELRWKPFRELSDRLDENISDFDHLRSLMDESQFFNERGKGFEFTKRGLENIALIGEAMAANDKKNLLYRQGLEKLEKEYKNGNISLEEYTEKYREYKQVIQDTATANKQYEDELVNLYKTKITNENNALQEQINKRKEALQQTKSYYDYLDSIKDKNKDINQLRAQINALEGVTDMASQARLATLRAQLAEKEEDLNKTRRDHDYEIQQTGYDKMSQDANKVLDDEIARVESNAIAAQGVVKNMLGELKGNINSTKKQIDDMIDNTGTVVAETTDTAFNYLQTRINEAKELIEDFLNNKKHVNKVKETTDKIDTTPVNIGDKKVRKAEQTADNDKTSGGQLPHQKLLNIIEGAPDAKDKKAVDGQSKLYNYIREHYKKRATDAIIIKLAEAMGIELENKKKPTAQDKGKILKKLQSKGLAKGTLGTKKDELDWTHEGEIIRRSDGAILRQLPAGTQVVPKIASENLIKWGQINPNEWAANIAKSLGSVSNNQNQSTNVYYDSVIHVDGSVDVDVMDRLEELGKGLLSNKSFTQGTVNIITKEYKREARKTGMR